MSLAANCDCSDLTTVSDEIVMNAGELLATALSSMKAAGTLPILAWNCDSPNGDNATRAAFDTSVNAAVDATAYLFKRDKHNVPLITAPIEVEVATRNKSKTVAVGKWRPVTKFVQDPTYQKKDIKRFFRVGRYWH